MRFPPSVLRLCAIGLLATVASACGGPAEPAPDKAELGTAYSFDMYTHCGAREALFAGEYWEAVPGAPERTSPPQPWDDPYQSGTMTRVSETSASFEAKGRQMDYQLRPGATGFLQICA